MTHFEQLHGELAFSVVTQHMRTALPHEYSCIAQHTLWQLTHLNGSLLGCIILLPDEVNKSFCASFAGPHVTDGVMAAHVGPNFLQQLWPQDILAHLLTNERWSSRATKGRVHLAWDKKCQDGDE